MAGPPRDSTPDEEASGDDVSFTEAVRHPAAEGGEQRIRPFEEGEDESPVRLVGDGGNVRRDGTLHGAEHLPVEVVQEGDWEQEGDEEPGPVEGGFGVGSHGGTGDETRRRFFRKEIWLGCVGMFGILGQRRKQVDFRKCLLVGVSRWAGYNLLWS